MVTALAIVLLVLFVASAVSMVCQMARGNPFAWLWFMMGGLESVGELIGLCLAAIFSE